VPAGRKPPDTHQRLWRDDRYTQLYAVATVTMFFLRSGVILSACPAEREQAEKCNPPKAMACARRRPAGGHNL